MSETDFGRVLRAVRHGYNCVKILPSGDAVGVMKMMFTWGLFVGVDKVEYDRRYCYETASDAVAATLNWDGRGDPPGPWIKEKPSGRLGPGAA